MDPTATFILGAPLASTCHYRSTNTIYSIISLYIASAGRGRAQIENLVGSTRNAPRYEARVKETESMPEMEGLVYRQINGIAISIRSEIVPVHDGGYSFGERIVAISSYNICSSIKTPVQPLPIPTVHTPFLTCAITALSLTLVLRSGRAQPPRHSFATTPLSLSLTTDPE